MFLLKKKILKSMNKKKKKEEFVDDGRTIYPMDIDGFKYKRRDKSKQINQFYSKEEKKHIILAGFKAYLPSLIIGLVGFTLAFLVIYFWLKP